jgi:DNA-binding GntR family transcriptional regulator
MSDREYEILMMIARQEGDVLEKIEKPVSLDERAYLNIKDAILKCILPPGVPLAEVRLAEELGVSKTPIRNAMARLQQEGFLVSVPYKGHFVADISIGDINEIYGLRVILECHLVRETAAIFDLAELDEIERTIDLAHDALDRNDIALYFLLNRDFHHSFDRKYGQRRISDVLTNLDEHVQRIIFFALKKNQQDLLDRQRDEHRLILNAVREGDIDSAVLQMENHLKDFCNHLVSRMMRSDEVAKIA